MSPLKVSISKRADRLPVNVTSTSPFTVSRSMRPFPSSSPSNSTSPVTVSMRTVPKRPCRTMTSPLTAPASISPDRLRASTSPLTECRRERFARPLPSTRTSPLTVSASRSASKPCASMSPLTVFRRSAPFTPDTVRSLLTPSTFTELRSGTLTTRSLEMCLRRDFLSGILTRTTTFLPSRSTTSSSTSAPRLPETSTWLRDQPRTSTEPAVFSIDTLPSGTASTERGRSSAAKAEATNSVRQLSLSPIKVALIMSCRSSDIRPVHRAPARDGVHFPHQVELLAVGTHEEVLQQPVVGLVGKRPVDLGDRRADVGDVLLDRETGLRRQLRDLLVESRGELGTRVHERGAQVITVPDVAGDHLELESRHGLPVHRHARGA